MDELYLGQKDEINDAWCEHFISIMGRTLGDNSIFICNRTHSSTKGKDVTPEMMFTGKKPHIGHLQVFGCIADAQVPDAL